MTYEGQVAGVQDAVPTQRAKSAVVRRIKALSMTQLEVRRREQNSLYPHAFVRSIQDLTTPGAIIPGKVTLVVLDEARVPPEALL